MPVQDATPHIPVMLEEVVGYLSPRPGGRYLDGTLGLAGHSLGLLRASGGAAQLGWRGRA